MAIAVQPEAARFQAGANDAEGFRAQLTERGSAFSTVVGQSMMPFLRPGDILRFAPCDAPRVGQIVAFVAGPSLIVHRVVRADAQSIVCRGDNRVFDDPAFPPEAVLGVLTAVSGRSRVPDTALHAAAMRFRYGLRRTQIRAWRLAGEARLFAAQAGLPVSLPNTGLVRAGYDESELKASGAVLVEPSHVESDGSLAGGFAGESREVVVPAGVFCRLAPDARARLLRDLSSLDVVVWAYPQTVGGRLLAWSVGLRRRLAAMGVDVRTAGETFIPGGPGGAGVVLCTFTPEELRPEIRASVGESVSIVARDTQWGCLLRGAAAPRQGAGRAEHKSDSPA